VINNQAFLTSDSAFVAKKIYSLIFLFNTPFEFDLVHLIELGDVVK